MSKLTHDQQAAPHACTLPESCAASARVLPQARRRQLVTGSAALAGMAALGGFPAIVQAQTDKIKIGHLTPRTGFLGALGEYSVMAVTLAVEEVNKAGGVLGRQIDLIAEDSVNPSTASRLTISATAWNGVGEASTKARRSELIMVMPATLSAAPAPRAPAATRRRAR